MAIDEKGLCIVATLSRSSRNRLLPLCALEVVDAAAPVEDGAIPRQFNCLQYWGLTSLTSHMQYETLDALRACETTSEKIC